jgi:hypothetical protein
MRRTGRPLEAAALLVAGVAALDFWCAIRFLPMSNHLENMQ